MNGRWSGISLGSVREESFSPICGHCEGLHNAPGLRPKRDRKGHNVTAIGENVVAGRRGALIFDIEPIRFQIFFIRQLKEFKCI